MNLNQRVLMYRRDRMLPEDRKPTKDSQGHQILLFQIVQESVIKLQEKTNQAVVHHLHLDKNQQEHQHQMLHNIQQMLHNIINSILTTLHLFRSSMIPHRFLLYPRTME